MNSMPFKKKSNRFEIWHNIGYIPCVVELI